MAFALGLLGFGPTESEVDLFLERVDFGYLDVDQLS